MVCDYWECERFKDCKARCIFSGAKYPFCASCIHYDLCDFCANYVECADLVTKFLPQMFRRMVREIRLGEDTLRTEQYIRRNTRGGKRS